MCWTKSSFSLGTISTTQRYHGRWTDRRHWKRVKTRTKMRASTTKTITTTKTKKGPNVLCFSSTTISNMCIGDSPRDFVHSSWHSNQFPNSFFRFQFDLHARWGCYNLGQKSLWTGYTTRVITCCDHLFWQHRCRRPPSPPQFSLTVVLHFDHDVHFVLQHVLLPVIKIFMMLSIMKLTVVGLFLTAGVGNSSSSSCSRWFQNRHLCTIKLTAKTISPVVVVHNRQSWVSFRSLLSACVVNIVAMTVVVFVIPTSPLHLNSSLVIFISTRHSPTSWKTNCCVPLLLWKNNHTV